MKDLKDSLVKESRDPEYEVAFIGFTDEEKEPIQVTITVNSDYKDEWEKFLQKEADNIFFSAYGGYDDEFEIEN